MNEEEEENLKKDPKAFLTNNYKRNMYNSGTYYNRKHGKFHSEYHPLITHFFRQLDFSSEPGVANEILENE